MCRIFNGTQFTSSEFKFFCKSLQIQYITTLPYHLRLNGHAKRFVDTFKRALKNRRGGVGWKKVAEITPNPNNRSGMSPAEMMFAKKIRSVFNKMNGRHSHQGISL